MTEDRKRWQRTAVLLAIVLKSATFRSTVLGVAGVGNCVTC